MPVEPLSLPGLILVLAAVVIGLSKTSVGGFAALAVAAFAVYLPTKESTAAVLLLLLIGDVVGVARYRKAASWPLLRRLLPSVLPGVAVGAVFLRVVDDHTLRLWRPGEADALQVFEGHTNSITGAAVLPGGEILDRKSVV